MYVRPLNDTSATRSLASRWLVNEPNYNDRLWSRSIVVWRDFGFNFCCDRPLSPFERKLTIRWRFCIASNGRHQFGQNKLRAGFNKPSLCALLFTGTNSRPWIGRQAFGSVELRKTNWLLLPSVCNQWDWSQARDILPLDAQLHDSLFASRFIGALYGRLANSAKRESRLGRPLILAAAKFT